jgi:glutamate dehydrogenase/leucine dehydrogenase
VLPPQGKRVLISGAGNVATYAAEKLLELGATVLTLSDSTGYVYEPEGFTKEVSTQWRPAVRVSCTVCTLVGCRAVRFTAAACKGSCMICQVDHFEAAC